MKKLFLLSLVSLSLSAFAQVSPQITGAGAPTNPCFNGGQQYLDTTNHVLYGCPSNGANWYNLGLGNMPNANMRSQASDPATCSTVDLNAANNIYYNTTSAVFKWCSATNTWTALGAAGGSGTVSANNGVTNAIATYAAAGGSTTVGPAANTACIPGATSGSACFTAPAVAGTTTNPMVSSNAISVPAGAPTTQGLVIGTSAGLYQRGGTVLDIDANGAAVLECQAGSGSSCYQISTGVYGFTSGAINTAADTGVSRLAAGVVSLGNGFQADETALFRAGNSCRVTADITLPVNTATTVCTWSLPAVAKAWAWQCEIPWVISAGSGTNTLAIIANASQTPTGTTNGFAEILTTNTGTATEATTAISASGATTLLTSGTITPNAAFFSARSSGTLLASGTAGTFSIQMTAAGTTATAAAKAGATCILY